MASLEADVFTSKQFTFLVGVDKAVFHTHSAVIAKQSTALNVLINGKMSEAENGSAALKDVDKDTFERFCQFAYTGNYTTPTHIEDESVDLSSKMNTKAIEKQKVLPTSAWDYSNAYEVEPADEVQRSYDIEMGWGSSTKKGRKAFKALETKQDVREPVQAAHKNFENLISRYKISSALFTAPCQVRQNTNAKEDYTSVLMGHAKLYVFADQWGVEALKTLALSKLHATLNTFTLYEARRGDIVALLRYAYDNENTRDRGLGDASTFMDELRLQVILYAGYQSNILMRSPQFIELIGDGGEFAQDFTKILMGCLGWTG